MSPSRSLHLALAAAVVIVACAPAGSAPAPKAPAPKTPAPKVPPPTGAQRARQHLAEALAEIEKLPEEKRASAAFIAALEARDFPNDAPLRQRVEALMSAATEEWFEPPTAGGPPVPKADLCYDFHQLSGALLMGERGRPLLDGAARHVREAVRKGDGEHILKEWEKVLPAAQLTARDQVPSLRRLVAERLTADIARLREPLETAVTPTPGRGRPSTSGQLLSERTQEIEKFLGRVSILLGSLEETDASPDSPVRRLLRALQGMWSFLPPEPVSPGHGGRREMETTLRQRALTLSLVEDALECLEGSYERQTPPARTPTFPIFAPFGVAKDQPETVQYRSYYDFGCLGIGALRVGLSEGRSPAAQATLDTLARMVSGLMPAALWKNKVAAVFRRAGREPDRPEMVAELCVTASSMAEDHPDLRPLALQLLDRAQTGARKLGRAPPVAARLDGQRLSLVPLGWVALAAADVDPARARQLSAEVRDPAVNAAVEFRIRRVGGFLAFMAQVQAEGGAAMPEQRDDAQIPFFRNLPLTDYTKTRKATRTVTALVLATFDPTAPGARTQAEYQALATRVRAIPFGDIARADPDSPHEPAQVARQVAAWTGLCDRMLLAVRGRLDLKGAIQEAALIRARQTARALDRPGPAPAGSPPRELVTDDPFVWLAAALAQSPGKDAELLEVARVYLPDVALLPALFYACEIAQGRRPADHVLGALAVLSGGVPAEDERAGLERLSLP